MNTNDLRKPKPVHLNAKPRGNNQFRCKLNPTYIVSIKIFISTSR